MPHILLVEDDEEVRFVCEHVLIDAGHEVDAVGTMKEALQRLRDRSYDLVVADGKLPDGTGLDIADRAAQDGVITLVMTGYAFTLPTETARRYEILLKPLHPHEIVDAVERALRG